MSRYIDADKIQYKNGIVTRLAIEEIPTEEVRPMQVELTEELKEEIKQTLIQSNKDLSYALEDYDRGWLGGNLEIVRILEKHYGKIIDDDEIMRESEEEE